MKKFVNCATGCIALLFFACRLVSAEDGAGLYKELCASCHDAGNERVPSRETLRSMSPERVLAALQSGVMISMASGWRHGGIHCCRRTAPVLLAFSVEGK